MKILYHHRTRSKDGQNVHIEELTAALRRRGHEIVMVGPAAVEEEDFGAEAGVVAMLKKALPKAAYEIMEYAYAVHAYRRLKAAWAETKPDVLYERHNLFFPAGVWLKRKTGIPMLSEVNAPLAEERSRHDGMFFKKWARNTEWQVWRAADYVLPVTDVLADYARAADVPEDRIRIVPNGINRERFPGVSDKAAAKKALGVEAPVVLGFTGFIRAWHGLERVVDLIADSDPALGLHFVVVGEGPAKADVEQRAADRGVTDRVTFTGLVDRDRIADVVSAFDIALQPDVTDYASPLKLFEYMAVGSAVIAPDKRNLREILTDGTDALLFDADDPDAFGRAIAQVAENADLRLRLGTGAAQTIEDKGLTWDRNAERVEALFEELLAARGN